MNTPPASDFPQPPLRTPPAVPGTPILGNLPAFLSDPLSFLLHVSQAYGPVVRFSLANQRMYLINDPEGIQRVLQGHNANYVKGKLFDSIRDIAGNGLFTSEGAFWLRQRRLMQPSFHRQQVASFGAMMTAASEEQLATWAPLAAKGEPLDLLEEMTRLTLASVSAALFGKKVRASEDITGAVPVLLDYMAYRIQVPFSAPRWVPTPRNLRVRAAERRLD
jgi:cytochrome P450